MAPCVKLVRAVSATLSPAGDGPSPLSDDQAEILADGCKALHAEFGVVSDTAERAEASRAAASMLASGRWATFHAVVSTMARTWPARVRPATLFIARTAVLRADGAAYLAEEARPGVMGERCTVGQAASWLAADALPRPAATAAMGLLQNAAGHAAFGAVLRSGPLAELVLKAALHAHSPGSGAPTTLRRSAAAVLHNLALAVDASVSDAGELTEGATAVLLGLADALGSPDPDSESLLLKVTALGRLVKRAGPMAAALASSMDVGSVLLAAEGGQGLSDEAKAACAACRAML